MGDTGSEGSKPPSNVNVIPPRCPCGFWGSSKTMNLCSKCFADIQKKQPDDDCASKASSSSSSSQADIFCNDTNSSISQSLMSVPNTSEEPSPEETAASSLPAQDEVSSTDAVFSSLSTPTKRSFESASESESDVSPEKRARVGEVPEGEESSSSFSSASSSSSSSRSGSKQRSRKRCHRCQTKLELVQQELGSCRCGYVFCMLHRLPEQHECLFDHLGRGRQEAVLKMVKLDRKVGRSCQRIDAERWCEGDAVGRHPRWSWDVTSDVRWTKTAGSASDKFQETSIYNETLRIEGIQRVQGGRYYCKADNGVGVAAIKSIRVDVQCKWAREKEVHF
uniref:MAM domain containing glycosylphosphatidylinositol anchor 1 n=1 Tax=Sparus aurata TaxID=8175 RepID=A0A671VAR6_SPAAU